MALEPGRYTPGARPGEPGYDPGNGNNRPVAGRPRDPAAKPGQPGYDPGHELIAPRTTIATKADPHVVPGPAPDQPHKAGQKDDPTVPRR